MEWPLAVTLAARLMVGGRRESRVIGRRSQRNGGRQLVRDRHTGSGGSEGAAGIIDHAAR